MKRVGMLVVVALLLLVPVVQAQERPDAPPYAVRGPYAVGVQDFTLEDETGALQVTAWYPAQNPEDLPQVELYQSGILSGEGRALRDAAPDAGDGPYPLVVFSHGLGGIRLQSIFLTEHLASQGFVVMAADHPGSTTFEVMLGASTGGEGIFRSFASRPLEVLRQIAFAEQLTAAGGILAGMIDTDQVAVAGHSFGGYTSAAVAGARLDFAAFASWCESPTGYAFDPRAEDPFTPAAFPEAACHYAFADQQEIVAEIRGIDPVPEGLWPPTTDPRIKAMVLLAPSSATSFGAEGLAAVDVPALIVVGAQDKATVPEYDAYRYYNEIGSVDKTLVVLENAGHYIFLEECPTTAANLGLYEMCSDLVWDMDRAHDMTNYFVTAFLKAKFYGDAAAGEAIAPGNADFTGVYVIAPR